MGITITEEAAKEIVAQAEKRSCLPTIRVGIRGGGCTGYTMFVEWNDFNNVILDTDSWFEKDGASVLIDNKSLVLLDGSVIDYERGLMNSGFRIDPPKSTGQCGCGESIEF